MRALQAYRHTRPQHATCTPHESSAMLCVLKSSCPWQAPTTTFRALGPWLTREALRVNTSFTDKGGLQRSHWIGEEGIHPTGVGHTLLADVLVHLLWRAGQSCASDGPRAPCHSSQSSQRSFATSCMIGGGLLALVKQPKQSNASNGPTGLPLVEGGSVPPWAYVVENDKPGLVANTVGSVMQLRLGAAGASNASNAAMSGPELSSAARRGRGTSAVLNLVYLRSYEHMGIASFSCHHRCSCNTQIVDAHNLERVSLETVAPPLEVRLSPHSSLWSCIVQARILSNSNSGEHKFKLTGLIVRPPHVRALGMDDVQNFVDYSSPGDFKRAAAGFLRL